MNPFRKFWNALREKFPKYEEKTPSQEEIEKAQKLDEVLDHIRGFSSTDSDYAKENKWAIKILEDAGYLEGTGFLGDYQITNDGTRTLLEGGFISRLKLKYEQLNNLIISTKLNKWFYRLRWIPYAVSLLSLLVSLYAVLKG